MSFLTVVQERTWGWGSPSWLSPPGLTPAEVSNSWFLQLVKEKIQILLQLEQTVALIGIPWQNDFILVQSGFLNSCIWKAIFYSQLCKIVPCIYNNIWNQYIHDFHHSKWMQMWFCVCVLISSWIAIHFIHRSIFDSVCLSTCRYVLSVCNCLYVLFYVCSLN